MTDKEVLKEAAELLRHYGRQYIGADSHEEQCADALEAMAQRCGEPLYLLHCGKIDGDGEQDEWDVEADSWRRVEDFCRQHPGETVSLYAAHPPAIPEGYVLGPKELAEAAEHAKSLDEENHSLRLRVQRAEAARKLWVNGDAIWSAPESPGEGFVELSADEAAGLIGRLRSQLRTADYAIKKLLKQLPPGTEHCTIRFHQCEKGHGSLTATNWGQAECPWCQIADLRDAAEDAQSVQPKGYDDGYAAGVKASAKVCADYAVRHATANDTDSGKAQAWMMTQCAAKILSSLKADR